MDISTNTSRTTGASRSSRWPRRALGSGLLCAVTMFLLMGTAIGQERDAHDRLVPAVLSPYDSPVCAAAGLSTLIVPTEAGVLDDALVTRAPVDVDALLRTATTPTLIFCGQVTATQEDETECDLDDLFSVLVPDDGSGGPISPFGAVIDAISDTSPEAAERLGEAMGCTSPAPDQGTPNSTTTPTTAAPPTTTAPAVGSPAPPIPPAGTAPTVSTPTAPSTAVPSTESPQLQISQPAAPLIPASSGDDGHGPIIAALAGLASSGLWLTARRRTLTTA